MIIDPSGFTSTNTSEGPLSGLRVIDLSTVFAVPYIGGLLSDMGADVIKIESPERLDQTRGGAYGPWLDNVPTEQPWDRSGTFHVINRGKRSLILDLKADAGRKILRDLVDGADILLDNFTPRVLRGWGLTYDVLAENNRGLIHLSNSGYGSTGPWSEYKAQGTTLEYTMGVGGYSGYRGEPPTKIGQSYPDFLAAWTGATAIMAALVHRHRTGEGQWIDMGMYQLGAAVIPEALIATQAGETDIGRRGNDELQAYLSGVFETAESGRWVAISTDERAWDPDVVPASLDGAAGRAARRQILAAWVLAHDPETLIESLHAWGATAAPVNDARDLVLDTQLAHRGFYEWVNVDESTDERPVIGTPYLWEAGGSKVYVRSRAPRYGEHNTEILDELGVPGEEQVALIRAGVVTDGPRKPIQASPFNLDVYLKRGVYSSVDADYRRVIREARFANRQQENA
ncbi:hypothetical protein AU252_01595 [Pseudarthrobacter sulfonivorans]|uniref:Carnitine dehydratase n=1 Tax=Pseudarthrobacter sulfonivorans TaxID=121292 RepID=A0A0U3QIB3_9MICC|nr:CaiB/BaiF CoA-transferase family protein [Pseudarthrobacter sulfonivorans]ALV40020.1 hypothetical protein AU252_01595 [Pseudarthrobacter sulfonivorans]